MFLNSLHRWLNRDSATAQQRRPKGKAKATGQRPLPLILETLEDRTVPTVLFAPHFGVESPPAPSVHKDTGLRINSPDVYVVLWGKSWGALNSTASLQVLTATSGVLNSTYLDGLAEYGVTKQGYHLSYVFDNVTDPSSGFAGKVLTDEINNLITNKQLPDPAKTPNMIIDMVTNAGIASATAGAGGYNNASIFTTSGKLNYWFIWNGTTSGSFFQDSCSLTFGHEMAECMTDPGSTGYEVNPGKTYQLTPPESAPNQVCDFEGNSYQYRMGNGTLVQPYWSAKYQQWLVTDGNAQILYVKPNWSGNALGYYDMTANGGQVAGPNGQDYILVNSTSTGLVVVLNNELFQFEQPLGTLTVNTKGGLVRINGSPGMTGITVNASSGTEVDVASNAFVSASVTINDASTVVIGPGNRHTGKTGVEVDSPHVRTSLIIDDRQDPEFGGFLVTGYSIDSAGFDVRYTGSQLQKLSVLGGAGGSQVFLGSRTDPLDALPANISVVGGGGSNTLDVNGSDSTDTLYAIDQGTVNVSRLLLRPRHAILTNQITYSNLSLTVDGGAGGNTFTVGNTSAFPTTLNTGSNSNMVLINGTSAALFVNGQGGADTVNIGSNGSMQQIGGVLVVTNDGGFSAVNVDDSADTSSRTVILYNNGFANVISGLTPPGSGDIWLDGPHLSSLSIRAGMSTFNGSGNTFRIHDTPFSLTPGGLTTSVFTGPGPDQVTIDGTTGALAVDVQGAQQGGNSITIGSPAIGLDGINGPIGVTGIASVANRLTIDDAASTIGHNYVMGRDFVQRLDKARIDYKNLASLDLRAGSQTDHIVVQDTMPVKAGQSTAIDQSGGDDQIDVLRTTGTLLMYPGGHSVINVGDDQNSLDNIQGAIGVVPSGAGNAVTLNLNDQAATTPEQFDIVSAVLGTSFQRSGAANIQVLVNPLDTFQWTSGSGGTTINEFVRPALTTNYILGNDGLNIGSKAKTISDLGPIFVTGGIGFDAITLNDSGETRPQSYTVSQIAGHEIFATRGTTVDLGPDLEEFELLGGSGGNAVNVAGTIAGMETRLHAGKGLNTITAGGAGNSLQALDGPVTLDGKGTSTLIVDDRGNSNPAAYLIDSTTIRRADASGLHVDFTIDYSGFAAVVVYGSNGGTSFGDFNSFEVAATPAGTSMTLYGDQSITEFVVGYPMSSIKGPLNLHGQTGHDFALFNDSTDPIGRKFTLTANQLAPSGIAPIGFDGLVEVVLYNGAASDKLNVQSVAPDVVVAVVAGAGDAVVIGSNAPALGGTLANILGPVLVESATGDPVAVTVDDSGDTVGRQVSFLPDTNFEPDVVSEDIVGLAPATIILDLRSGAAATVLAGSGNDVFNVQATQADTPLTLKMGGGDDIVNVGSADNTLGALLGPLTLSGQGGVDQLTFNDQGTTTRENYTLAADQLTRVEATGVADDMAPISFASFKVITLNVTSGGSSAAVIGNLAGTTVTVNGNAGSPDDFAIDASSNAILGPVTLNGQAADGDFAQYYDIGNTAPHTYTLTSTSVRRDGQATVFTNVGAILYAPMVGGNSVNVTSVALGGAFKVQAANGDQVTVGSKAPRLGGTLTNILDQVNVVSYTPNDAVSFVIDDSGNTDTTATKHIAFGVGFDADGNVNMLGLTSTGLSWRLPSASSVTVRGGAANEIFSMQPSAAATPVTIVGGSGSNTLDYSAYATDVTVNLQTGMATDLAGIKDPNTGRVTIQNVIGGSGNDTLIAGAGRSVLIGGGGVDHLFGGSGQAILIGGTTDYTQPGLNSAALDAIFQEWNRTDLGFDDRVSDLMTGSSSQGVTANNVVAGMTILLNSTTVHDDLAADVLTGGTGRDWFFISPGDLLANNKPGDMVT
jgi:hypothetical protein